MSRIDMDPGLRGKAMGRKAVPAAIVGVVVAACTQAEPIQPSPIPLAPAKDKGSIGDISIDTEVRELRQKDKTLTLVLARRILRPEFLDRFSDVLEYHPELMGESGQFVSAGSTITLGARQEAEMRVINDYRAGIPERSTFEVNVLRSSGQKPALAQPDLGPDKSGVPRIKLERLKQLTDEIFILPKDVVWEERDFVAFGQGQYEDGRRIGVRVIENGSITLEVRSKQLPPPRSPLPPLREED